MKSLLSRVKGDKKPASGPRTVSAASGTVHDKENRDLKSTSPIPPPRRSLPSTPVHSPPGTRLRSPDLTNADSVSPNPSRPTPQLHILDTAVIGSGNEESGGPPLGSATGGKGQGKKVTFRSPVPTPTVSVVLDDAINLGMQEDKRGGIIRSEAEQSNHVPGSSPSKLKSPPDIDSSLRPSTAQSLHPSRPRPISRQTSPFLPSSLALRPPSSTARKASMPAMSTSSSAQRSATSSPTKRHSLLSPTPSESSTAGGSRGFIPQPNSWSEMAAQDLVANLGHQERTRQEVLWEIVSSEERYVHDLSQLNETFCRQILPPSATSPHLDLIDTGSIYSRGMSPSSPALSGNGSFVNLPIAARYATPVPTTGTNQYRGDLRYPSDSSASTAPPVTPSEDQVSKGAVPPPSAAARMNAYSILTNGRPSQPSRRSSFSSISEDKGTPNHSLPPPSRQVSGDSSHMSYLGISSGHHKLHKTRSRVSSAGSSVTNRDFRIPDDLEKVLTVLAGGIMEGHIKLLAALKRRYDEQYPLVRSLADVFTAHSSILREYSTYVCHLERALTQVDEALSIYTEAPPTTAKAKRNSKRLEESEHGRLGKFIYSLEELAASKGEAGLVISLSKPFQRLLKYPLLFQNLLFNTDPSLREYEATLGMVQEVESIVRHIEDEKSNEEEREKTRDVWARIDGLERDKIIMAPKPSRVLISETQFEPPATTHLKVVKDQPSTVKGKKSFKRLSDILKGGGDGADLWVVRFTDVSLLCEKTGITHLPLSSLQRGDRFESNSDLWSKRHSGSGMTKRSTSMRARNMYKFVKVHGWHLRHGHSDSDASLAMKEPPRRRQVETTRYFSGSRASTLPSIAGTPNATPSKEGLRSAGNISTRPISPTRHRSRTHISVADSTDEDEENGTTVTRGRGSGMPFRYSDYDGIQPTVKTEAIPRGAQPSQRTEAGLRTLSAAADRQRTSLGPSAFDDSSVLRKVSVGSMSNRAADAKFGHRLRSPDWSNAADRGDVPIPGSASASVAARNRRSLPPPSTTISGGLKPLQTAASATYRGSAVANRPAWNAGSGVNGAHGPRRASTPTGQAGSRSATPSLGNESVGRRVPIGRASFGPAPRPLSAIAKGKPGSIPAKPNGGAEGEVVRRSTSRLGQEAFETQSNDQANRMNAGLRTMPSKEDSIIGLWRVYGEDQAFNLDTPEKAETFKLPTLPDEAPKPAMVTMEATKQGTPVSRTAAKGSETKTPEASLQSKNRPPVMIQPARPASVNRAPSKAATVGRGGQVMSSRKRDLGGKV
ncbi:hypothetical protein IAU60_000729 [Kwoniella sp. DSM 27419]